MKKSFRSSALILSLSMLLVVAGCGQAENPPASTNQNPGNTTTPPPATTTNPPATTTPPMTTEPVYFMCELTHYPETVWPLLNVQERQNHFGMDVYYPADFGYEYYKSIFNIQYSAKATEAEVLKHYRDLLESLDINAVADVQGFIGEWNVYADTQDSFYTGEQVVNVMVINNVTIYDRNPYFADFSPTLLPAFPSSEIMRETFKCWPDLKEYYTRYRNNGTVADAVNHYRSVMAGAANFTETEAHPVLNGTSTILKGTLGGYQVEIEIRDWNNLITVTALKDF
ncbi:hypothetical protein Dehly_1433 [Dehalogenimonas lykanthroporepellens BL-DC-9]|nr:hypothetical protein Dehly_1433 [Dehalogenimonas lykanthroporepellens BL-DC-9]